MDEVNEVVVFVVVVVPLSFVQVLVPVYEDVLIATEVAMMMVVAMAVAVTEATRSYVVARGSEVL